MLSEDALVKAVKRALLSQSDDGMVKELLLSMKEKGFLKDLRQ